MNKSHRDIKTGKSLKEEAKDVTDNVTKERNHTSPEWKPDPNFKRRRFSPDKAKRVGNYIMQTVASENKLGEFIHGILDIAPIPNQGIAKIFSSVTKPEQRKEEMQKLFSLRNGIAVAVFLLIVFKVVTVQDAVALLKALMSFV